MKILLGLTGSVATTLHEKLENELLELGDLNIVATSSAYHFTSEEFKFSSNLFADHDEWQWNISKTDLAIRNKWQKDDRILHIELRDWADVFVIAPCSANTLAKLANGLSDNLLSSIARAWDYKKRLIIAPAMNTQMWEHPVTVEHITKLKKWGAIIVPPQSKMLACGTEGIGAMAEISDIVNTVKYKHKWFFPIKNVEYNCPGVPVKGHPGSFLQQRKHHIHTGVDLYTSNMQSVYAVEDGVIVGMEPFTGAIDGSPWWENTWCILVEGESGVVCYGELCQDFEVRMIGDKVKRGCSLGNVKRVLKENKSKEGVEGHLPSMLHLELYKPGIKRAFEEQGNNKSDWNDLIDPTPYLLNAEGAPSRQLH